MSAQSDPTGVRFGLPSRWTPPDQGDLILVGALLFVVLLSMGLIGSTAGNATLWFVIGALQVLPLLFRRQAPLLVASVIALACVWQLLVAWTPNPANIAVLIAIFSAAVYGTRVESVTVLCLGLLGAALGALRWAFGASLLVFLATGFLLAMFVVLAWLVGDVTRRRNAVQARLADQNRALARDEAQRRRDGPRR